MIKNFGVIKKSIQPSDYIMVGEKSDLDINPSGNWSDFLPIKEYQHFEWGDAKDCVTMSALNCIETLLKYKYNIDFNASDKFTAKMSGTTHRGNWMTKVADSIRNDGLVLETDYPSTTAISWEDFYKPIIEELKTKGKRFKELYDVDYRWLVPTNAYQLEMALKRGPIQVVIYAWEKPVNGIYERTEKETNHAVELFNSIHNKYFEVFDHYDKTIKKLAWNYKIQHGFIYNITRKNMRFIKEKEKEDVYLLKGGIAYAINDRMDYLNLEQDWSPVIEVEKITQPISSKKMYIFVR